MGFTNPPKVIRGPVSVDAYKVDNICNEVYTSSVIINNTKDVLTVQQKRGHVVLKRVYVPNNFLK